MLLSKVHNHWWKHEGEALKASLLCFCPGFAGNQVEHTAHYAMAMPVESLQNGLAVASSHSHQTQRLCGSSGFVSRDRGVLELQKPQTFENSRFQDEIQGDCNLSSQLRAPAKSREWRHGPNAVHNQSDSRARVGVRRKTMVVYRAAFVAMSVEFIQALPSPVAALLFVQACSVRLCSSPLSWLVMTAAPTGPARTLQCPCLSM